MKPSKSCRPAGAEITASWIDELASIASSLKRIADHLERDHVEIVAAPAFDPCDDILRKAEFGLGIDHANEAHKNVLARTVDADEAAAGRASFRMRQR
jgi:hypothetical protein